MSSLLHQHIVKIVREEKERDAEEFAKTLEWVRSVEISEEEGFVSGQVEEAPNFWVDPKGFERSINEAKEAENKPSPTTADGPPTKRVLARRYSSPTHPKEDKGKERKRG